MDIVIREFSEPRSRDRGSARAVSEQLECTMLKGRKTGY